ncbi:MAG: hypothetical protein MHM6MM_009088, partial [Cercozoa sp. M6MM]
MKPKEQDCVFHYTHHKEKLYASYEIVSDDTFATLNEHYLLRLQIAFEFKSEGELTGANSLDGLLQQSEVHAIRTLAGSKDMLAMLGYSRQRSDVAFKSTNMASRRVVYWAAIKLILLVAGTAVNIVVLQRMLTPKERKYAA